MSTKPRLSLRLSLTLYVGITALYALLVGWWVYFFSQQDDLLIGRIVAAGGVLDSVQIGAIHEATQRTMRMFLFEGAFLGLLLLGSVVLVLRSLRSELALHKQQHNFLSAVTHELRSPIASARLYIDSIAMGRTDRGKTDRYLMHAREDLDRLGAMVDDLLSTRRLTREGVQLEPETLDLAELVRHTVDRIHLPQGVQVELTADQPVLVRVDPGALEKVVDNLVGNAIKYGGDTPQVTVTVAAEGGRAYLEVRDHGPGLVGADPERVFEPFVRGRDENVRTQPGAGLGLFIVREFVRAHGGDVKLLEAEDGGVVARVWLDIVTETEAAAAPREGAAS